MNNLVIVGAGGFGTEITILIDDINREKPTWSLLGFIDNWHPVGKVIQGYPVIGNIEDLNGYKEEIWVILAFGDNKKLYDHYAQIQNPNVRFANLIHPTVHIDPTVKLGHGNILSYCTFISCNVVIGDCNVFNIRTVVGHDAIIGSFNMFNPGVVISGAVNMGNHNFWGLNSSIVQCREVGNGNRIGAHSLLVKSIKDDGFYFGNPASI